MNRTARIFALSAALLGALPGPVMAQTAMPPFSVFGEADDEINTACKVAHAASVAAVERELRSFGIRTLPHTDQTLSKNVILAYVKLTSLQIKSNGTPNGSCATAVEFEVYSNTNFTNPVNGASHFGKVVYCNRSSILVWSAVTAQSAVNKDLISFVPECIKDYNESKN